MLEGRRILVGTRDLFDSRTAGIGRYGRGLVRDLAAAGVRVSALSDCPQAASPAVQEALLYRDPQQYVPPLRTAAFRLLRALWRPPMGVEFRLPGIVVPPGTGTDWRRCLSSVEVVPDCYRLAYALAECLDRPLRVRTSRPVAVWHALKPLTIRVQGAAFVVTVHDLVPLLLPYASATDPAEFHTRLSYAVRHADALITVSEHTRRDLLRMCRVSPGRVFTVHPGLSVPEEVPSDAQVAHTLRAMGLRPRGYILFCSTIEPRKNLLLLMNALCELRRPPPLVVCGREGWLSDETIRAVTLMQKRGLVVRAGYVSDEWLRALYLGALFFAFPSLYEGFGLPAVEAMAHGCPVLASHAGSLPEVCGEAALYVDPLSEEDVAAKLRTMLEDEELRLALAEKGRLQAGRFSSENHRRRLAEVYEAVL